MHNKKETVDIVFKLVLAFVMVVMALFGGLIVLMIGLTVCQ